MGNILLDWVFDPERTLQDEIEQLSDPKVEIEIERVANLVVKFLVNFSRGGWCEDSKIIEADVNNAYMRVQSQIWSWLIKWILRWYFGTGYQERMLSCPSSLNITRDIISYPLDDVLWNKSHFVIDAWSGSWILQTAFYIQARRNWLEPSISSSRGIEKNIVAQRVSNRILSKLWIGHVIRWNSLEIWSYESLWTDFIHSFGNENLVDSMDDVRWEPFIDNLQVVQSVFWDSLKQTQFLPYHILFMTPLSINTVDSWDLEDSLPVVVFSWDVPDFLARIDRKIEIVSWYTWRDMNSWIFFPSDIKITPDSEPIFLEELWQEWIGKLFHEHPWVQKFQFNNSTRWRVFFKEYMRSIPNPIK